MDLQNFTINKFDLLFEEILKQSHITDVKISLKDVTVDYLQYELFHVGIKLCEMSNITNEQKMELLYKLLLIFPKCYILYYFMGILTSS